MDQRAIREAGNTLSQLKLLELEPKQPIFLCLPLSLAISPLDPLESLEMNAPRRPTTAFAVNPNLIQFL